ncbi:cbs domain-containing protein [Cyclospora cayetanensis]|uniref:Cbs domain-containing protein n=1 Tax=Cyclospora cayetanensis TaxID=88456 RepID=A0A1D3D2C4_9EIME|nr:cbs domain-containing protein [Cyclospora cayetanensis]
MRICLCVSFQGEDLGTIYDRTQLRALVDYHDNVVHVLTSDEARILKGGLDFAFVRVDKVMTPLDRVCGLEIDTKLTFDVLSHILSCGFSRIPVLDRTTPQCIVGLLYVKDLALFDPYAEVEVRTLLHLFGRNVYAVDEDTALLDLLTAFKKGHTHLAVVRSVECVGVGDPYYRHVGIITLEDIIEEILQDEIHDEFDHDKQQQAEAPQIVGPSSSATAAKDSRRQLAAHTPEEATLIASKTKPSQQQATKCPPEDSNAPTGASSAVIIQMTAALSTDRRPLKMISPVYQNVSPPNRVIDEHTILRGRMKLIDHCRMGASLSRSEALAVSTFLCCAERCFQPPTISPMLLLLLLQHMRLIRIRSGVQIFSRGSRAYHAALVLQGRLKLEVGSERIACRVGPWTTLGMHCLSMDAIPEAFQAKRARLQELIGDQDFASFKEMEVLKRLTYADAPTAGSCGCGSCSSEVDKAGDVLRNSEQQSAPSRPLLWHPRVLIPESPHRHCEATRAGVSGCLHFVAKSERQQEASQTPAEQSLLPMLGPPSWEASSSPSLPRACFDDLPPDAGLPAPHTQERRLLRAAARVPDWRAPSRVYQGGPPSVQKFMPRYLGAPRLLQFLRTLFPHRRRVQVQLLRMLVLLSTRLSDACRSRIFLWHPVVAFREQWRGGPLRRMRRGTKLVQQRHSPRVEENGKGLKQLGVPCVREKVPLRGMTQLQLQQQGHAQRLLATAGEDAVQKEARIATSGWCAERFATELGVTEHCVDIRLDAKEGCALALSEEGESGIEEDSSGSALTSRSSSSSSSLRDLTSTGAHDKEDEDCSAGGLVGAGGGEPLYGGTAEGQSTPARVLRRDMSSRMT